MTLGSGPDYKPTDDEKQINAAFKRARPHAFVTQPFKLKFEVNKYDRERRNASQILN